MRSSVPALVVNEGQIRDSVGDTRAEETANFEKALSVVDRRRAPLPDTNVRQLWREKNRVSCVLAKLPFTVRATTTRSA